MSGAATATCPSSRSTQIDEQLALAVDRVMSEGSLYDRELAALAIKQARGDLIEAIFLVRAFRATLPRFGATEPVDTGAMQVRRRISSTFKDIPGGQILGPTFDYTHRLLDPQLARGLCAGGSRRWRRLRRRATPRVTDILGRDGLIEPSPQAEADGAGRRPHARAAELSGRSRSAPAKSRARRRRLSAGARLFDAARLWPQPSVRRRDPLRRGRGRILRRGCRLCRAARIDRDDRMPDGQPVQGLGDGSAVLHPRLWPGLRPERAQDHVDGAGRPRAARPRARRGSHCAGAGRGIRDVAFRQCAGDRLRRASEAAALCRLPVRARPAAQAAQGVRRGRRKPAPMQEAAE